MPLLAGKASKNFLKASRPPAEAPSATTRTVVLLLADDAAAVDCGGPRAAVGALRFVISLSSVKPLFPSGKREGQVSDITLFPLARPGYEGCQVSVCCCGLRHVQEKCCGYFPNLATQSHACAVHGGFLSRRSPHGLQPSAGGLASFAPNERGRPYSLRHLDGGVQLRVSETRFHIRLCIAKCTSRTE